MKPSPLLMLLWNHLLCRSSAARFFRLARRGVRTGRTFVGIRMTLRFAEEQKAHAGRAFDAWCKRCLHTGQSRALRDLGPGLRPTFKLAA